MTEKQFSRVWAEAIESSDRENFVSRVSAFCGLNNAAKIWDIAHMSVADIRRTTGLSQAGFAQKFCIPKFTVINWEQRGSCAPYIRLMLARLCGLAEGVFE